MFQESKKISGVPTNIITGFLGAGKTSTILRLLENKPKEERWAVLVNEFGDIGIDGALLEGQYSEQKGVYIREVPGGCMCCTAGLPMRVALTQLLRRAKPDRLLIEPTGLGHPMEVLQTLNEDNFHGVLAIQKIVTLVDARNLSDSRYADHETFQQQIAIADVIVGNKQDLYDKNDKAVLRAYLEEQSLSGVELLFAEQGNIEITLLDGPNAMVFEHSIKDDKPMPEITDSDLEKSIPDCGYIKAINKGEGFVSVGWRFSRQVEFDRNKLFAFLSGITAQRLKATFVTGSGGFGYNLTPDALTEMPLDHLDESRIEIINNQLSQHWEAEIFDCISINRLDKNSLSTR